MSLTLYIRQSESQSESYNPIQTEALDALMKYVDSCLIVQKAI